MGYLKKIGTGIIYISFFLAVITFLPGLLPEVEFSEYSIKTAADTQNRIELKNRLQGAEVLFSGEIKGPEYFASYNEELYAGIRGGYVVKVEENRITPIVKFGKKCDGLWQEEKCGRPLGLQFNSKGDLFVADAYYGIFKVNVNTRQYTNIVNSSVPINGKIPKLINALDIAKNGDIYWTDSSTDFYLHDGSYTFLANPSGRLIRYNAATKRNEVLLTKLGFANGILLSDDESFLIVLESLTSRIVKYHLKGSKAGQHEIFAEALPGIPDNVHSDGQGGFLVTLIMSIDPEHPFLPQSLAPHPHFRKMFVRLLYLIEAPFKLLQDVYPNYYAERVLHSVGSFDITRLLDTQQRSIVLRIDKAGNILDALYSEDGKVQTICSAYIHNGYLWLGSPWNEYILRVPLKQAFPDLVNNKKSSNIREKREEPIVTVTSTPNIKVSVKPTNAKPAVKETTAKPTITTPKPTTTTPKPTTTTPKPTTTTPKPTTTTSKPTIAAPKPTIAAPKPITKTSVPDAAASKSNPQKSTTQSTTTTTTPKPASPSPKVSTKESKDSPKEVKKDKIREIKKDNSNSNVNTKTPVKTESSKNSNEETVKPKSAESIKKSTREAQPEKSKTTETKSDSIKK